MTSLDSWHTVWYHLLLTSPLPRCCCCCLCVYLKKSTRPSSRARGSSRRMRRTTRRRKRSFGPSTPSSSRRSPRKSRSRRQEAGGRIPMCPPRLLWRRRTRRPRRRARRWEAMGRCELNWRVACAWILLRGPSVNDRPHTAQHTHTPSQHDALLRRATRSKRARPPSTIGSGAGDAVCGSCKKNAEQVGEERRGVIGAARNKK